MEEKIFLSITKQELEELIIACVKKCLQETHNYTSRKKVPRKEAAKILHCSERTLDEMTRNGELQGFRMGNRIYYNNEDLEKAFKKIKTFN